LINVLATEFGIRNSSLKSRRILTWVFRDEPYAAVAIKQPPPPPPPPPEASALELKAPGTALTSAEKSLSFREVS